MKKSNIMFKSFFTVTVFFSLLFMVSCSSSKVSNSNLTVTPTPDGFSNPDMVLLVQKKTSGLGHNRKNNNIDASFKKYYTGKFEMVSREDIDTNPKYKDKTIYRYIYRDDVTEAAPGAVINYSIDYLLYDRVTDTEVALDANSGLPAEANDIVAKKLNKYLPATKTGTWSAH